MSAAVSAAGVLWKAVRVAARAINERDTVAPILTALVMMRPPLVDRLDHLERRLDAVERAVGLP